ncbi:uncharacterized protein LTR77_000681 [Saxophila tyrrhenica]|uniref:VOC domain-containing protein n=1 Tax=Saxophila tyrrhenica TaxID=1690608 RepID=A0AAV9PRV4_9PEZI|nr:hypothetical protein LTR77_000681 [Saxophila tyrrhenica]
MVPHPYKNQNLVFNHIGISVKSVDKAADRHSKPFGFRRITNDASADRSTDGSDSPLFRVYGDKLQKVKIAFLATGNGVGFKIFEFIDPPVRDAEEIKKEWSIEQQYQRGGYFHIAVTAPDPDAVAEKAFEDGAVRVGETIELFDGDKALYLRDQWGNAVEVLSWSLEQMMGNRG